MSSALSLEVLEDFYPAHFPSTPTLYLADTVLDEGGAGVDRENWSLPDSD